MPKTSWCYHCFKAIDPWQVSVQCRACHTQGRAVRYHRSCWEKAHKCQRCGASRISRALVLPSLPAPALRRRASLPRPVHTVSTVVLPGPLFPLNPLHHLLRLWWLLFDPAKVQQYAAQYTKRQADLLDWWIACLWVFLVGLGVMLGSLSFHPEWENIYLAGCVAGFAAAFAIVSGIGSLQGGFYRFLATVLLGIFASIFLYALGLGTPTLFALADNLTHSLDLPQSAFMGMQVIAIPWQVGQIGVGGIALAFAVAQQTYGWRSIKAFVLFGSPVLCAGGLAWWVPSLQPAIQQTLFVFALYAAITLFFLGTRRRLTRFLFFLAILLAIAWFLGRSSISLGASVISLERLLSYHFLPLINR